MLPAGITAALSILFYFLPALEPRREGLERSQGLYLWGWVAILLIGAIIELAVVSAALGWPLETGRLIVAGSGAMLVLIGNQLGKSRSMYLIGMRTPWTLASEEVWIRTHRLAGKLMVAAGLVVAGVALIDLPPEWRMALLVAAIALSAGIPIALFVPALAARARGSAQRVALDERIDRALRRQAAFVEAEVRRP